jgi:hypothetical protein
VIEVTGFTIAAIDKAMCQDAVAVRVIDERIVLCVADGAGGSPLSECGARLAVECVVEQLSANAPRDTSALVDAVASARDRWSDELLARELPDTAKDTTLGVAASVGKRWMFGAVGDAFAATISNRSDPVMRLPFSLGRVAERSANDTDVWGLDDWPSHFRTLEIVDPELFGVMLSTDGLEKVAIAHGIAGPEGQDSVDQVGVLAGTVDRVFDLSRRGWEGSRIGQAMAQSTVVMTSKGDDIGVAVATW